MFIDALQVPNQHCFRADVCIVGAGAAGLTLGTELDGLPFDVMLLESGGFDSDIETQALYEGSTTGEDYSLLECRLRYFGGTTNHWPGTCVPLDALDFEVQPWLPYSGWPFQKHLLDPFYERAQVVCGLPQYACYEASLCARAGRRPLVLPDCHELTTKMVHFPLNTKLRFGRVYRSQIQQSRNVTAVTRANVTEIRTNDSGEAVEQLQVQSLSGHTFTISARYVILATGGIENARLLLASDRVHPNGIGNDHDLVGRFFMEHFYGNLGVILPLNTKTDFSLYTERHRVKPGYVQAYLTLSEHLRMQQRLSGLQIRPYHLVDFGQSPGALSFKQMRDAVLERRLGRECLGHIRHMTAHRRELIRYFYHHTRLLFSKTARLTNPIGLSGGLEQEPNPNNRVKLSMERDRLGQRCAELHFRFSRNDWDSCTRSLALFDCVLQDHGMRRVEAAGFEDLGVNMKKIFGSHHMGTTRMQDDPKQGVVTKDCRVHGVANLFIAGCSVFPTGGSANPTLTIVALAIRLADHIKELIHK